MSTIEHDFYGSLAPWWPLISPVGDYADEAAYLAQLLHDGPEPTHSVLELGSGGGHLAHHLTGDFALTLTDLSADMLAVSRALNPDCVHHRGDMRTLRLAERFDAVLVHDAIDYMTTEADLAAAFATAHDHLHPGGRLLVIPDHTAETFEPGTDVSGTDGPDGRGARLFEWTWDPDPADTWAQTEYVFVLRDADGAVTTASESHRHGLFPEATWIRLLSDAGYTPTSFVEETDEDRPLRTLFVAHR
ncbi:MAG: class I SAM-dependent methyltransferase [Acidimicrobiales bacterium]